MFGKRNQKKGILKLFRHKKIRLGIAFGGGGARGIAHIGVIKAFEELGLDFDIVCGTSAGAIVGALYSAGFTYQQIKDLAMSLRTKDIKTSKLFFMPSKASTISTILKKAFGKDLTFEELKKQFCAVAVDIRTGNEIDFMSGEISPAVAGSCAVPGVFVPVSHNGMYLVDGGLKNNVPADIARKMGADVVIAIDVNHGRGRGTDSTKLLSVLGSTIGVLMRDAVKAKLSFADIVLEPELTKFPSTKLQNIEEMIQIGYDTVMENVDKIAPLVSKKIPRRKKKLWKRKLAEK